MSTTGNGSDENRETSQLYEIRVQGHLGARWADSLQGMTFTLESGGITALTGPIDDQAELHGLLARLRDIGVPIISFRRLGPHHEPNTKEEPPCSPSTDGANSHD